MLSDLDAAARRHALLAHQQNAVRSLRARVKAKSAAFSAAEVADTLALLPDARQGAQEFLDQLDLAEASLQAEEALLKGALDEQMAHCEALAWHALGTKGIQRGASLRGHTGKPFLAQRVRVRAGDSVVFLTVSGASLKSNGKPGVSPGHLNLLLPTGRQH